MPVVATTMMVWAPEEVASPTSPSTSPFLVDHVEAYHHPAEWYSTMSSKGIRVEGAATMSMGTTSTTGMASSLHRVALAIPWVVYAMARE